MRTRSLALLILFSLNLLAGCLQGDPSVERENIPHPSLAGGPVATGGFAPSARDRAYNVTAENAAGSGSVDATAYPLRLETTPAKAPVTLEIEGAFEPGQCAPADDIPLPLEDYHWYDLREGLEAGDVFSYEIELKFTNTDNAWGDLHLSYGIGGSYARWSDSVGDERGEIKQTFTGQGYRLDNEQRAWAAVSCWYGVLTRPLPYTLTVTYFFAESSVPAEVPLLVNVPDGATRLFVTGIPLDPAEGVRSHYRVFGPDDELLCECALNSQEATDTFHLAGPGEYVLLVDHTANGFVALALDAPPTDSLLPLAQAWTTQTIFQGEGGAFDETLSIDVPRVPLDLEVWYRSGSGEFAEAGGGKNVHILVTNGRGEVLRAEHGDFTMVAVTPPGWRVWQSMPGSPWEEHVDHHTYDKGPHQVRIQADWFRGVVNFSTLTYARP